MTYKQLISRKCDLELEGVECDAASRLRARVAELEAVIAADVTSVYEAARADEREACARVVSEAHAQILRASSQQFQPSDNAVLHALAKCAAAIRARGD